MEMSSEHDIWQAIKDARNEVRLQAGWQGYLAAPEYRRGMGAGRGHRVDSRDEAAESGHKPQLN